MQSAISAAENVRTCLKNEDMYRNLTFVHKYMVTGNKEAITEGLPNRICCIFMDSLKFFQCYEQSQTTICCCVHCKDNILLLLTTLHLLSQNPGKDGEIKGQILSDVRSTIYKNKFLHKVLVTLMDCTDEHIRYMASKCVLSVLLWTGEKEHATPTQAISTLTFDLTKGLELTNMLGLNTRLSILTEIFSGKHTPVKTTDGVRMGLLDNLAQKWEKTVTNILNIEVKISSKETTVYSVLCLWVKLLKYCNQAETIIQKYMIDTKIFYSTSKLLLRCDTTVFSKWYIDVKRYKILMQIINAGTKSTAADRQDNYIDILKEILEKMPSYLMSTPTTGVQHCFGGHSVESEPYSHGVKDHEKIDSSPGEQDVERDIECVRSAVLVTLKACSTLSGIDKTDACRTLIIGSISQVKEFLETEDINIGENSSETLIDLYCDQDDKLMEALNNMIDIFLSFENHECIPSAIDEFNPHYVFIAFLGSMEFDYSLMLDFLTSPETCFLQYFVKYLKYTARNWDSFQLCCQHQSPKVQTELQTPTENDGQTKETDSKMDSEIDIDLPILLKGTKLIDYSDSSSECDSKQDSSPIDGSTNMELSGASCLDKTVTQQNSEMLDEVMTSLIRLRISLDKLDRKNLFPYNIKPVIHLIVRCEELYES